MRRYPDLRQSESMFVFSTLVLVTLVVMSACVERERECVDADYPIEPLFDTPEEAVHDALEAHPEISEPGHINEYQEVERADGWIDFEFQESEYIHHSWGITRDEDGRWGMTSLGGCFSQDPFR